VGVADAVIKRSCPGELEFVESLMLCQPGQQSPPEFSPHCQLVPERLIGIKAIHKQLDAPLWFWQIRIFVQHMKLSLFANLH